MYHEVLRRAFGNACSVLRERYAVGTLLHANRLAHNAVPHLPLHIRVVCLGTLSCAYFKLYTTSQGHITFVVCAALCGALVIILITELSSARVDTLVSSICGNIQCAALINALVLRVCGDVKLEKFAAFHTFHPRV